MKRGTTRLGRILLACVAAVAVTTTPLVNAAPAQAAVVGFNPGNIISDSLFYNGNAMSAGDVQSFLNQRVPRCTIGDPGRQAGMQWGNTVIANTCLRGYAMNTVSKPANAHCGAYVGRANESAAEIIAKVGQACGISQRVLLITLEKEQSLVSDSWPTQRQIDVATGYACPDSGPGWAANCNPEYYGFQNQVYYAAWQLKVYRAFPGSFNYKPFQYNTIQYHPNPACGSSQVYIENWATAALYIYTPYQPNAAALAADWGTGDGCSSYGNRNFYNFYVTWFGSTQGGPSYPVNGGILTYWNTNKDWLGQPTAAARSISSSGGGYLQDFEGGFVYLSNSGVAAGLTRTSQILQNFAAAGGLEGSWGWPISPAVYQGSSGNNVMQFQGGIVVEAKEIGVFLIPNALASYWQSSGGFNGSLGVPTAPAKIVEGSVSQRFQKNAVVKIGSGQPLLFDQRFLESWENLGGASAAIGLPVGAAVEISAGGGGQEYPLGGGMMYRSAAGVFAFPNGNLLTLYKQAGGPAGAWGWPTGKPLCSADGTQCSGTFVAGVAVWTERRGSQFTSYSAPAGVEIPPGSGESVTGGVVQ